MAAQRLQFGPFEVDLESRRLTREGRPVPLQEKPFALLASLLRRPGEVVSRETLERELWGEAHVDSEHGINTAVRKLREALADEAQNPRYIETVARRGHRFVAPLTVLEDRRPHPRHRRLWVGAAAALTVACLAWLLRDRESPASAIRSIAVLPLADFSAGGSQGHLAAGVTEELTARLARSTTLRVVAHSSAREVKRDRRLSDVARDLGVDAVVEGAVIRSPSQQVRITVQLIEGRSDSHLWAASFDGNLAELSALESRVAEAVAQQTGAATAASGAERRIDPTARELWMRGNEMLYRGVNDMPNFAALLRGAVARYDQALALQPDWPEALASRARAEHWLSRTDPVALFERSRRDARRAIALDETVAMAHGALGYVSAAFFRDFAGAERELQRAVQLDPNTSYRSAYGIVLMVLGRADEAAASFAAALERDPLALVTSWQAGKNELFSGRTEDALRRYRLLDQKHPGLVREDVARVLAASGRPAEAVALLRALELDRAGPQARSYLVCALVGAGDRSGAAAELERLAGVAGPRGDHDMARAQACLGNREVALEHLLRAERAHVEWLSEANVDPAFDGLRGDPRFVGFLAGQGIPEANIRRAGGRSGG